jgi:hypothetical protein
MLNPILSWTTLTAEEVDRLAWEVICSWHQAAGFTSTEMLRHGIDYSHLLRCFLLDKVSRAIRKQLYPEQAQFEEQLLAQLPPRRSSLSPAERIKRPLRRILAFQDSWRLRKNTLPMLFTPYRNSRLKATMLALSQSQSMLVATPYLRVREYDAGYPVRLPHQDASKREIVYAKHLHQGVITGLRGLGVELSSQDAALLKLQILQQVESMRQVESDLNFLRPQAILVFSDNHYPIQGYVHMARRMGIPAIMLQHGLDCEHYCLDEAYASVIAVWGEARQRRYQRESIYQPTRIQVTGNPEFDHLRLPDRMTVNGQNWLWVTRPHRPEKCYSPSRQPQEGLEILAAIASALKRSPHARLVIKPHPYDYADLYQEYINQQQLSDRAEISTASVQSLLPQASLVISEDSTAGLEAMFWGKLLIHAHFAACKPTLPFAAYGAALPAYSAELLQSALEHAPFLTAIERDRMLEGQRHFATDYAGLCDGQAHERMLALISEVMFFG